MLRDISRELPTEHLFDSILVGFRRQGGLQADLSYDRSRDVRRVHAEGQAEPRHGSAWCQSSAVDPLPRESKEGCASGRSDRCMRANLCQSAGSVG